MIARLLVGLGVLGLAMTAMVLANRPRVASSLGVATGWAVPRIPADTVVARVHHEPVTWTAVAQRFKEAREMGRAEPSDASAWRRAAAAAIESIVDDVLTRHVMEAAGFTVDEEMLDAAIAELRERHGGGDDLARAMGAMGVSMPELRETQRRGLYLQAFIDRSVPTSEADIDEYLSRPGAVGLGRDEAATRVRAERAAIVIPALLAELRADPHVWVIPIEDLERVPSTR